MTRSSGTLTIGTHGETNFMSSTARAEVCLIIYCDALDSDRISCTPPVSYGGNSDLSILIASYTNVPAIQPLLEKAPTWATLIQNSCLPARVLHASIAEHDVNLVDEELRQIVMSHRPPLSEAIRLCEIYLDWGNTLFVTRSFPLALRLYNLDRWNPLSRHELLEEMLGNVYRAEWVG